MQILHALAGIPLVLLTLLAGPYRAVAFKLGTFGGVGTGLLTWAGIIIGYPVCVALSGPPDSPQGFLFSWGALILIGWIKMFACWCSSQPRRDAGQSHCWAGSSEPLIALMIGMTAAAGSGLGGFVFFLAGYASSLVQIGLVRLRLFCKAWTPEDTKRVLSPVGMGTVRAAAGLRVGAMSLAPVAMAVFALTKSLFARAAQPAAADVQAEGAVAGAAGVVTPGVATPGYRPPSFSGRVMSHIVAHFVISLITGAIGIGVILKYFTYVLAFILMLLGWELNPPDAVKEEANDVMQRGAELYGHEKAELGERFDEGRESLTEEVERRKRQAIWDFFTP